MALVQNPDEWAASLLLGLDALNQSKDTTLPETERSAAIVRGSKMIEMAFRHNKFNAAAANALSDIFLRKRQYKNVRQYFLDTHYPTHISLCPM